MLEFALDEFGRERASARQSHVVGGVCVLGAQKCTCRTCGGGHAVIVLVAASCIWEYCALIQ